METTDGATLLFEARGVSLAPAEDATLRDICSAVRFHTAAEHLRWLNDVVVVEEGQIHLTTGVVRTRGWVCVPEAP